MFHFSAVLQCKSILTSTLLHIIFLLQSVKKVVVQLCHVLIHCFHMTVKSSDSLQLKLYCNAKCKLNVWNKIYDMVVRLKHVTCQCIQYM